MTRWGLLLSLACVVLAGAGPAAAAGQFTVDLHAHSFGAIVTDSAGNGYLAWEHGGGSGADVPMFCKLAPGATSCPHPAALALPGGTQDPENSALSLFPILGSVNVVWVVTSRYLRSDTVIWTSLDGGRSFGAPHDIPSGTQCLAGLQCEDSVPTPGLTGLDDTLPITTGGATYGRQPYVDGVGQPYVPFLQSSVNPGLGFDWDATNVVYQFEPGVSEFTFANPGSFVNGSALGTTSSGDVVEVYWTDSSPEKLAYYAYTPTPQHPDVLTATQAAFTGPTVIANGYLPRLADGAAGLFMLSTDLVSGSEPTAVEIRKYSTTTHSFAAPRRITSTPASSAALFVGGGLGENYTTGELAAVSPSFNPAGDVMRLFLSTDGGAHFSPQQDVATIGGAYAGPDNARVAIADNGTGFVTFQDSRGLQVADLRPLGAQFQAVHRQGKTLGVPVTCAAPKHGCTVKLTLSVNHFPKSLSATFKLGPGVSRTVGLHFSPASLTFLSSHRHPVGATLTLKISSAGTSTDTLVLHPKL